MRTFDELYDEDVRIQNCWRLLAMHDPTGRRGLWWKSSAAAPDGIWEDAAPDMIEIRAGRDGNDSAFFLDQSNSTDEQRRALLEVVLCTENAFDQGDPEGEQLTHLLRHQDRYLANSD